MEEAVERVYIEPPEGLPMIAGTLRKIDRLSYNPYSKRVNILLKLIYFGDDPAMSTGVCDLSQIMLRPENVVVRTPFAKLLVEKNGTLSQEVCTKIINQYRNRILLFAMEKPVLKENCMPSRCSYFISPKFLPDSNTPILQAKYMAGEIDVSAVSEITFSVIRRIASLPCRKRDVTKIFKSMPTIFTNNKAAKKKERSPIPEDVWDSACLRFLEQEETGNSQYKTSTPTGILLALLSDVATSSYNVYKEIQRRTSLPSLVILGEPSDNKETPSVKESDVVNHVCTMFMMILSGISTPRTFSYCSDNYRAVALGKVFEAITDVSTSVYTLCHIIQSTSLDQDKQDDPTSYRISSTLRVSDCDMLAMSVGQFEPQCLQRLLALGYQSIETAEYKHGHTCVSWNRFRSLFSPVLSGEQFQLLKSYVQSLSPQECEKEIGFFEDDLINNVNNETTDPSSKNGMLYRCSTHKAEVFIANVIARGLGDGGYVSLNNQTSFLTPTRDSSLVDMRDFIEQLKFSKFNIIHGPGGVGKTTFLSKLIQVLDPATENYFGSVSNSGDEYSSEYGSTEWLLLAPTGKAANILANKTRHKAFTIHMALYNKSMNTYWEDVKYIVIDEFSMVSMRLMAAILSRETDLCKKDGVKYILMGDDNQIPSIEPGRLLFEMLEFIPRAHFSVVKRTECKNILKASKAIIDKKGDELMKLGVEAHFSKDKSFRVVSYSTIEKEILDAFRAAQAASQRGDIKNGIRSVKILLTTNEGANTYNNMILQHIFKRNESANSDMVFQPQVGDRVICRRNQYVCKPENSHGRNDASNTSSPRELVVTNGSEGVIIAINKEEIFDGKYDNPLGSDDSNGSSDTSEIVINTSSGTTQTIDADVEDEEDEYFVHVLFDDCGNGSVTHSFRYSQFGTDLMYSYAQTICTSQASQWKTVFVVVRPNDANMAILSRNMLYTAVTRAEQQCILCVTSIQLNKILGRSVSDRECFLGRRIMKALQARNV